MGIWKWRLGRLGFTHCQEESELVDMGVISYVTWKRVYGRLYRKVGKPVVHNGTYWEKVMGATTVS